MNSQEEKNRATRSHPLGNFESPFLDEELFVHEAEGEWEARFVTVQRESPFQRAFEQPWALTGAAETESAEAFEDEFAFEEPGIIKGENRVRVRDTTGVPWRWICKIVIEDSRRRLVGQGTGVLISGRHVLTAAHVVYDAYKNMHQYTITVIPAINDLKEAFDSYSIVSKPKIRKEYSPAAADSLDWDYALLTLSTAIGKKSFPALQGSPLCYWGNPECGANTMFTRLDPRTLNGKAVYTAGYPGGKGGKQLWCAAGLLHSADERRRTMRITADTTGGQSGSPVWVIDNKRYCLVGVAVGAGTGSNTVVRVTRELIRQLRAWITEDGETPSIIETEVALEFPALPLSEQEAKYNEPPAAGWSPEPTAEGAEDFTSVDSEGDELELLHEQPMEERFDPSAIPKDVADALGKKDWPLALKLAIQAGWRENELTNLIFFTRHPELRNKPLDKKHPKYDQLRPEWGQIRVEEVRMAIRASAVTTVKKTKMPMPTRGQDSIDVHVINLPLFHPTKKRPDLSEVKQAPGLANCPVASILAALAFTATGQDLLRKMLTVTAAPTVTDISGVKSILSNPPSGTTLDSFRFFTVKLPGGSVDVSDVLYTDDVDHGWSPKYMHDPGDHSIWAAIIEKALAVQLGSYENFDALNLKANDFWEKIIGKKPGGFGIKDDTPLRDIIEAARASTRVASIGASKPNDTDVKVVTAFHGFAMLGFDGQKIKLYDPARAKILAISPGDFRHDFQAILFQK